VIWGETPELGRYPVSTLPLGLRSTLTALLAFGALLDRDLDDSEMLYYAARSSYLDIVDRGSLESVHLALQLAIFEMNSRRSSSVSGSLAVAIRTAQCLVRSSFSSVSTGCLLADLGPVLSIRICIASPP